MRFVKLKTGMEDFTAWLGAGKKGPDGPQVGETPDSGPALSTFTDTPSVMWPLPVVTPRADTAQDQDFDLAVDVKAENLRNLAAAPVSYGPIAIHFAGMTQYPDGSVA